MTTITEVRHPHTVQVKKMPAITADTTAAAPATNITAPVTSLAAPSSAQQGDSSSTNEEQINEAFAKLKVAMTNLDNSSVSSAGSTSAGITSNDTTTVIPGNTSSQTSAAQQFSDFMHLSPRDQIRAGVLADMGLTTDQYKTMSPADKAAIDQKVAEKMRDQQEAKTAERLMSGGDTSVASTSSPASTSASAQSGSDSKNDGKRESLLTQELS